MSRRMTVMLMSRGVRLNHLFRAMAAELAKCHRVIVLAFPDEVQLFAGLEHVEVRVLDSRDVLFDQKDTASSTDAELRSRVRVIEDEIGMPLYRAASNYFLHARITRSYGGYWRYLDTERDLLLAYVQAYAVLSKIFDELRPDVVYYENVDLVSTYIALALAYRRGVFALQMSLSPIGGKIASAYGIRRTNIVLEYLYTHRNLISNASYASADAVLDSPAHLLYETSYAKYNRSALSWNSPFNPARLVRMFREPRSVTRGFKNVRWHLRSASNRWWLHRHLNRRLPDPPYVAFPLSRLPEASTCSQAGRWVNQEAIVEQLAINAPSWLKIVVKEHPRSYGLRGESFLGSLVKLPNVIVCHPSVDNYALLARADAILATTGTTGLEGIVLGKRVGVLGRPYYATYKGAKKLCHPEEIFDAIDDPTWMPEHMLDERRAFLAAYMQSLHEFGRDSAGLYPTDGGVKWARALNDTITFIETHGLKPSDFDPGLGILK